MQMLKNYTVLGLLFLGLGIFVTACKDNSVSTDDPNLLKNYNSEVVWDWNETFLQVERYAAGYRPGPAPRALALMGLAAYEASISGMPDFNSMASRYAGLSVPKADENAEYYWPEVINASYGLMMPKFFPNVPQDQFVKIAAKEAELENKYAASVSADVMARSKAFGQAVGEAVWNWGTTDPIGHNHYLDPFQGYDWQAHYTKDGDWKPTFPGPGKPMGGVWGKARTFAITESEKLARPPLPFSEDPHSALYSQALEVYAQNTPTQSYEGKWVGEFWSDDLINLTFSPGPRWLAIGDEVIKAEGTNLEDAVFLNVKMGMALNDAAVACWYSKYYYNLERPQTYIQRVIDPNWKPSLNDPITGAQGMTPSFPAYPSGHSTMGGAGAEILTSMFGASYAMTDRCHENRTDFIGVPRSFSSFDEMAIENAWSRVPLGVHFRMDSEEGVRLGRVIGRKVNGLPWKK